MNNLTVTEFKDIRVLTTQQLAEEYETDTDTLNRNFNNNKERYVEGKHYILLQGEELKEAKTSGKFYGLSSKVNKFYLWTEKGCLLHAKSLNTDKAWQAYDNLVDTYFKVKDLFENASDELKAILMHDKKIQIVMEHMQNTDTRIDHIENTMVIDYGQQLVLKDKVNSRATYWLGGKESNAYNGMAKKLFSECNKDIQHYFNVNSRNNIPRIKFDDAVKYIENWEPCYTTKLLIQDWNSQINMDEPAM